MRWRNPPQLILALALIGMDTCAIYIAALVVQAFMIERIGVWAISPLLLAALELGGWLLGDRLLKSRLPILPARLIFAILGVILAAAALYYSHPQVFAAAEAGEVGGVLLGMILAMLPWLRGLVLAAEVPDFNRSFNTFRIGIGVLLASAVIGSLGDLPGRAELNDALGPLALAFFAFALLALASGNILASAAEAGADDKPATFGLRWGGVLGLSVLIVLLIGGIGVAAGLDRYAEFLQNAADTALSLVGVALYWIFYIPVWLLFTLIFDPLARLIEMFRSEPDPNSTQNPGYPPGVPLVELAEPGNGLPPGFEGPLKIIAVIVLALLLLWFVGQALTRLRQTEVDESGELERESLGGWDLFWAQIIGWFRRLLRLDKPVPAPPPTPRPDPDAGRADLAQVLSIRQVYASLQRQAALFGLPRRAAQTPDEYLLQLQVHFPAAGADLAAITDAYRIARYAAPPLPPTLADDTNNRWRAVQPLLTRDYSPPVPPTS